MRIDLDPSYREKFYFYEKEDLKVPVCPLILAVTGHRDIAPYARASIQEQTKNWFLKIGRLWQERQGFRQGETSAAPILVLNGLATGADSLVADTILEIKKEYPDLNYQLVAVLPMPKEIYLRDFTEENEIEKFTTLCDQADTIVELPLICENRSNPESLTDHPLTKDQRTAQYEYLGKVLASNSMFLLALWNGESEKGGIRKPGGTVDVVRMKIKGVFSSEIAPIEIPSAAEKSRIGVIKPSGAVFQIVTPRVSDSTEIGEPPQQKNAGDLYFYLPDDDSNPTLTEQVGFSGKKMDRNAIFSIKETKEIAGCFYEYAEMNRDALRHCHYWRKKEFESKDWLLGKNPPQDSEVLFMTKNYTLFDSLAQLYQEKFFRYAFIYLILLLFFTIAFYLEAYWRASLIQEYWHYSLSQTIYDKICGACNSLHLLDIFYFFCFISVFVLFLFVKKGAFYEKYHRYRSVAEIFRVQIFWHLAAISEKSHNHYLWHQINDMNWLRTVSNALFLTIRDNHDPRYSFVKKQWLEDQRGYFIDKIDQYKQKDKNIQRITNFFLAQAALWLILRIFVNRAIVLQFIDTGLSDNIGWFWYSVSIQFIAIGGMLALCFMVWNRLNSYNSLVKRYKKILPIYHQVIDTFSAVEQSDASQEQKEVDYKNLLRYIGEYALMENADWFLMTRKLELPK